MNLQLYENFSQSLAKPGKHKNGDSFKTIDSEAFLLAVVADGITSQPCDWYASQLCCEKLCELVADQFEKSGNLESLLEDCLNQVNEELLLVARECEGLGSTICGILWPKKVDEIFYFWLGDSKVYLYQSSELRQLSIDDSEEVVLSKNISPGNSISTRNYITNSMGRADQTIRIKKSSFNPGNQIILATDGFVESTFAFSKRIIKAINSYDLEKAIGQLFNENLPEQNDDSTVTIIRRKAEFTSQEIQAFLDNVSLELKNAPTYQELNLAFHGLKKGIEAEDGDLCEKIITIIKARKLKLGKDQLLELLDLVVKKNFNENGLYQELIFLIRKS